MELITSIKPLLAVLVTLLVMPILVSSANKPNVREGWTVAAGTIKFLIVVSMLPLVLGGNQIVFTLVKIAPGADIA
ncbi:MAG: monovalent cation/H+ antiporter subunit D family protein, partial [Desulfobacterales bacterium]|nr:monovalent cation/H+ antiporter subunit D family protein [Desulfobacterales bacterium]